MKNALERFRKRKKQDRPRAPVNVYILKELRKWAKKENLNLSLILEERLKKLKSTESRHSDQGDVK